MVTILLIVIYIAFIGLGIPDSLFGTAWPAIYTEYGLPISLGGVITMVTFIGTTISSRQQQSNSSNNKCSKPKHFILLGAKEINLTG